MKKALSVLLAVLLTVSCMILPAAAVDPEPDTSRDSIGIASEPSINVSQSTLNIKVGQTASITYSTNPAGQSVGVSVVSISHTSFSLVEATSSVKFTGTSVGTDTLYLTMKYNGQTYKTLITVNVTSLKCVVTLSPASVTMAVGESKTVLCSYTITGDLGSVKTIGLGGTISTSVATGKIGSWQYSTLNQNAANVTLTGVSAGSTTLKMYVYDKDTDEILGEASIPVTVTPTDNYGIEVSQSTLNIGVGQTASITYSTNPPGQNVGVSIVNISHTSFSLVEASSSVKFTGTSEGTDTLYLTMKYNGQTYKTLITVNVGHPDDDDPTFTVKETKCSGTAGSTVDVPVIVSGNRGICTAMLSVSYDASVLELVGCKNGTILTEGFTPGGSYSANPFRVAWNSGTKASSANGTMVTFTFRLKRALSKGESTAITLQCSDTVDINLAPVQFRTVNGSVTVGSIPGDVDGDGEVTLKDAALVSRHLVGGWNVTIDLDAADVNNDNDVTLVDAALISRYLVGGWNVVLI